MPTVALEADLARFVARQRVAHLATADATGQPQVVPICYALLGETLYSAIDQKPKRSAPRRLRRVRNILENPRAAVVVDVYEEDWTRIGYVLLKGAARLLDGGPEYAEALAALRAKYPQYAAMALEGQPLIAVAVERVVPWGTLPLHPPTSER